MLLQGNVFTLKRLSQIAPENPTFGENRSKSGPFILRILRIFFIAEYYGKLRTVMFPPPPAPTAQKTSPLSAYGTDKDDNQKAAALYNIQKKVVNVKI